MRDVFDLGAGHGVAATLLAVLLLAAVVVGIRLLLVQLAQQRRERQNRPVNERLKLLIAAYRTLGGSLGGSRAPAVGTSEASDAVAAALSDVILLGTAEQVRLAAQAADDLAAGRPVQTTALVSSLRGFIREVLDLEAVPAVTGRPGTAAAAQQPRAKP